MFSVPLERFSAEIPAPFPLFVFLAHNERMVPVRRAGDAIGAELMEQLRKKEHAELWVPHEYAAAFEAYREYVTEVENGAKVRDGEAASAESPGPAGAETSAGSATDGAVPAEPLPEPAVAGEAAALPPVSPLAELRRLERAGVAARRPVAARLRETADLLLGMADDTDSLYAQVLALRAGQDPAEHSVFTGSLCGALALEAGLGGEDWLADLIVAATFHDVGMTRLGFDFAAKPRASWSAAERAEYEGHVEHGVRILRAVEPPLPEAVIRIVSEHHERIDGQGFPLGLKGAQLHRGALLLQLADRFDRLVWGEETGTELAPAEAFRRLADEFSSTDAPALYKKVLQFEIGPASG